MDKNEDIYNRHFFERQARMEAPSAGAVAEILTEAFHPRTLIDIGCGTGVYLLEFQKRGVEVAGYDASPAALAGSLVGDKIRFHDLRTPLALDRKFDLCLCIEVAEHLPLSAADILVRTLCGLADTVVFTAATPGQGSPGIGHVNEQPHEFWMEKFNAHGFGTDEGVTEKLEGEMARRGVIWWIPKNLMIFKKRRI